MLSDNEKSKTIQELNDLLKKGKRKSEIAKELGKKFPSICVTDAIEILIALGMSNSGASTYYYKYVRPQGSGGGQPQHVARQQVGAQKEQTQQDFVCEVEDFVDWMVGALNEFPGFLLFWRAARRAHSQNTGLPGNTLWACTSLFSGFQQYCWPASVNTITSQWSGRLFDETEDFLSGLGEGLKEAIQSSSGGKVRSYCDDILAWGGVYSRKYVCAEIKEMREEHLVTHLKEMRDHLSNLISSGIPAEYLGYTDSNGHPLKLDSGSTKIFSLLIDEFVMYDGRVASALAFLVRCWWEDKCAKEKNIDYSKIPDSLKFSYDGNDKRRNPNPVVNGRRATIFPRLNNNPPRRIIENIRASWLLAEVLEADRQKKTGKSNFSCLDGGRALRALEAAIFMVGYDVSRQRQSTEGW